MTRAFERAIRQPAAHGQFRLAYISTSQLRLDPCHGDRIVINGEERRIPAAGVMFPPTGLTPGTSYYIYAYWTGTAIALEASTTGYVDASGGVYADFGAGVRVKSGDPSRTLVGAACIDTGPAFVLNRTVWGVRSAFNDIPAWAWKVTASHFDIANTSWNVVADAYLLCWAAEELSMGVKSQYYPLSANQIAYIGMQLDGVMQDTALDYRYAGTNGMMAFQLPIEVATFGLRRGTALVSTNVNTSFVRFSSSIITMQARGGPR
jgi:hypothetical protein